MPLKMYQEKKDFTLNRVKHIIGIAAGKGGVGKSTVTAGLALASKELGLSVGIMDADVYGPSMQKLCKEENPPMKSGEFIIPAVASGIPMISMAHFRRENEAAAIRAPIANGIIGQFLHQVDWGELDLLLIDFPPGTGDIQLTLAQQAPLSGAVVVTTPQELALLDVRKAIDLFDQVAVPLLGVVENMSYYLQGGQKVFVFGEGGGSRLAKEKNVPFLGEIPIHPSISACGDQGKSILETDAEEVKQTFRSIAAQLQSQLSESPFGIDFGFQQVDPFTFSLTHPNGEAVSIRLSELQKRCPCAGCVEKRPEVDENVKATHIQQVGRYGLKIQFTSGCSSGIYSFNTLLRI